MKKRKMNQRKKEEIAEDWCFICKDGGGNCRVCDHKDCLKIYHPECVGKEDSFLEATDRWICGRHFCYVCDRVSKFRCFCCTKSVCGNCISPTEFVIINGSKGFCAFCLKLVKLIGEDKDIDSDGEQLSFKAQNTVEFLFMDYWVEIINKKENVSLETIQAAYAHLKEGKYFIRESEPNEFHPSEEEDEILGSDYDASGDELPLKKRFKRQPRSTIKNSKSKNGAFDQWGSNALMEFLDSIGQDTTKKLKQDDVTCIIIDYVKKYNLFDPVKKKKVICDERLYSVLRRKSVNKNRISDLLDSHFAENFEISQDEDDGHDLRRPSSEGKDKNCLMDNKRERKSVLQRKCQEKSPFTVQQPCFASIVEQNMKLVYLRKSLVAKLWKNKESFEGKVVGSFVRVRSDPNDYRQKISHQLLQVTGIQNLSFSPAKTETDILLQISSRLNAIPISMLSDDYFSSEECEELRRQVEAGLHKNPTFVEFNQKVKTLHVDITSDWIERELFTLQNRIDQANVKGWRRELDEYSNRRQLLQTSSEQSRLLLEVPEVIGGPKKTNNISEEDLGDSEQQRDGSLELIVEGTSDIRKNSLGTSYTLRGGWKDSDKKQHRVEDSIPEEMPQQTHIPDPCVENNDIFVRMTIPKELRQQSDISDSRVEHEEIPQSLPPRAISEENCEKFPEQVNIYVPEHTSDKTLENHPIDVEDSDSNAETAVQVPVIELSDDEHEDEKSAVMTKKPPQKDLEDSLWHCMSPIDDNDVKGPFTLSFLKRWSDNSPYASKYKVWKGGQGKNEAILLSRAISLMTP